MTYNPALTGLRAVAIFLVVALHTRIATVPGGFFGVDLFFVLSGFLITSILWQEWQASGGIDLGQFYWNRLVRLTPALYLVLFTLLALGLSSPTDTLVAATYLANTIALVEASPLGHTWSLAVEEQFYLIWPCVLLLLLRSERPRRWAVVLALSAMIWSIVVLFGVTHGTPAIDYRLDLNLSGLLLGSAVALGAFRVSDSDANRVGKLSAYFFAFCVLSYSSASPLWFMKTIVDIASAGLIVAAMNRAGLTSRILSYPALVRIGDWSYAIYLWHYPIALAVRDDYPAPVAFMITLAISCALGAFTHHFVEIPMRRYRLTRHKGILNDRQSTMPSGSPSQAGGQP